MGNVREIRRKVVPQLRGTITIFSKKKSMCILKYPTMGCIISFKAILNLQDFNYNYASGRITKEQCWKCPPIFASRADVNYCYKK